MSDKPEGTKPEDTKPEGESKPEAEGTPETPQTPVSEPPTPPATKETTPAPNVPQTPAQGDDGAAKAKADAEAAAKEAAEAKAKAAQLELELNRERTARKHGIPDELMGMLRADSLEADAKALAQYVTAKGSSLGTGGLDPTDNDDPRAEGEALADRLFSANRFF
ncbi:hypothetical protein CPT_Shaeky_004 [Streptomyces phage Shaeky]|uniref:Scaffolding protein n=1 Tax=Streptomyces phage Shaeky TaxID=2767586 RepID=A0A873WPV0_9CAUD|nr:hypothetical protein CPT_Shaeky_004 [Streptomyces phage Shaeky]